jgi:ABC-2 type transport system ATP-binding protein
MLKVQGLEKRFNGIRAVDGIDFDLREGEIFGFLGPNGAGKTTTLSMISGLIRPDGGAIELDGRSIFKHPTQAKAVMGICPQEIALYEDLTGRDNLLFFGGLYGMRGRALRDRTGELLEFAGLTERAGHRVSTYSGGMQRRLNLACALVHGPRLLLLDEPTAGVDPQSRNAIFESILGLRSEGITILYTTHYMEEAQRLCERIAIIDQGKILALDTFEGLLKVIGSQDKVVVHVAEGDGGRLEAVRRKLGERGLEVEQSGETLSVLTGESGPALGLIGEELKAAGLQMVSADIVKPTLEAVFLHMTGRRLRD